jgi:hypothetical protein
MTPIPRHDYTVQVHKGRPVWFENGRPRPVVMYSPGDAFGNVGREDVDRFLAVGVTDFYLWIGRDEKEQSIFTTPWWRNVNELAEPDFRSAERFFTLPEKVEYIVSRCPDARFLLRFYDHPPKSWKEAHPEELAVDEYGNRLDEVSLASARFEADHRRFLAHLIGWIERQPWAWRVMGYLTLHDYEGTTMNSILGMLFDYSAPMQKAFGQPVPRNRFPEQRERGGYPHWPDPQTTQAERAYFELVRSLFLRRCRRFIETAQAAASPRQVLLGMDALKQGMQGWICDPYFTGRAPRAHHSHMLLASGSFGADEFFRIPGFKVLNTPYDYIYRHAGGACEPEGIVDSVVLRGKLFLGENDCRTYACSENGSYGFYRDPVEAEAGLWRTAGETIARGSQSYWMDVTSFPPPKGGYFRDDAILNILRQIVPVLRRSLDWEHADVPGVAMIVDDCSALEEDFSADFQNLAVMWQRLTGLAHCGVPYRIYLWEDLLADNLPDHRLFMFPNLFRLNQERLDILRQRVCRAGRVVLWGPGTGITDGKTLSAEWAGRVTGMPMSLLEESYARRVVLTRFDHPITARLRGSVAYGDSTPYGPILLPECDPSVNEQGIVLTTRGVNRPGLAIRDMGDWTSVFTAAVPVPAELIREMARHGGAHVYSEDNDVIFASRHFLAVHSVRPGRRTIRLPGAVPMWDAVTGRQISPATDRIELDVKGPQTRLLLFRPA